MRTPSLTLRLIGATAVALSLGACARQDRMTTGSVIPNDTRARHPIVLAQTPDTLDLFIAGSSALDARQRADVADFARRYKDAGAGEVQILTPRGWSQGGKVAAAVGAIRQTLAAAGLRAPVSVGSYEIADPALAAPVRLAFSALQARVATRCGEWPDDLGAAASKNGWDNRPYYNLGCATQQNLAAQVADPRDLARPRTLDPADVQMRTRAIGFVRRGDDPTTIWRFNSNPIGPVIP
jgi:pilus assembly protein CpaD